MNKVSFKIITVVGFKYQWIKYMTKKKLFVALKFHRYFTTQQHEWNETWN